MECGAVDGSPVEFSEEYQQQRIIITGGPGVGKTSVIRHYEQNGIHVIHEAATDVIREMLSQQIDQPWNQAGFNMRVVNLQLERQSDAERKKVSIVFFDRSPIDVLTYSYLQEDKEHPEIRQIVETVTCRRFYYRKVFLIENLGTCENTEVRAETVEEALKIEKFIEEHYRRYGFEVIRIPPASIEKRAEFILGHLKEDFPNGFYPGNVPGKSPDNIAEEAALVQQ